MKNDKNDKHRLFISFSGGRSSAVMLALCLEKFKDSDIAILFANTGCEHEETLKFVDAVDKNIANGRIIWIEADTNPIKGKGATPKIVTFETAARNGEPFEAATAKEGLFCPANVGCTSRLKVRPMHKYLRSLGWKKASYDTAIGIRADEMDRQAKHAKRDRYIYPLITAGIDKAKVNGYLKKFDWDLNLPNDAFGNCVWCWKKSKRKLMTVAKEFPEHFEFPLKMEEKYRNTNTNQTRQQFRSHMTTKELLKLSITEEFRPYSDDEFDNLELFDTDLDLGGGCGSSCEIGAD